jgi:hypothetical protein
MKFYIIVEVYCIGVRFKARSAISGEEKKGSLDLSWTTASTTPSTRRGHSRQAGTILFDKGLKQGGIYIVEDIEINYWRRGDT